MKIYKIKGVWNLLLKEKVFVFKTKQELIAKIFELFYE